MSDASDSQNMPSGEEPYAGEPSDLVSSESRTESDDILVVPALRVEFPFERPEGTDESPVPSAEGLVHREGRFQAMDEAGPSARASMSGMSNRPTLIDEEDDEGEEEDEEADEEGEEAGEEGEDEGLKDVAEAEAVILAMAKPDVATTKAPKKGKEIPPIVYPINVTVDGDAGVTRSIMTESQLEKIRYKFGIAENVILRIPEENEAACSYSESLDEVCLFEYMFT